MDGLESYKNIDGTDIASFLRVLSSSTSNPNDLDNALDYLKKKLVEKSPEKNSPSPKKNQKTLDGWLIRRNDTSKKVVEPLSHTATNSNLDKVPETEKKSKEINSGDLSSRKSNCSKEFSTVPSTSSLIEESSTDNDLSLCVSKEDNTNNLSNKKCASKSKRKASQSSPDLEYARTPKRVRSTREKQDHLHINEDKHIESNEIIDFNCTSESENTDQKAMFDNCNSNTKKNTYNLRTKAKNSKLLPVSEVSNNKSRSEDRQMDINMKNINLRSNNTGVESKYEAFNKLNEICKEIGVNVLDILNDKKVESVLNNPITLSNDAIVFIGSLKLNTGKTSPIVHLAESKDNLLERLLSMNKKISKS